MLPETKAEMANAEMTSSGVTLSQSTPRISATTVTSVVGSTASGVLIGGAFGGPAGAVVGGLMGLTVGVVAANSPHSQE